ncbi:MAG: YfhO family protein [Crocinitomicaceae bacterium]
MNIKSFFTKNWKHFVSLLVIVIIVFSYFKLQFEGYGLKQHDVKQFKGSAQEIIDYRENQDQEILWTNSMFGGMPSVQISLVYTGNLIKTGFDNFIQFVGKPASIVLISAFGFYIMAVCLGISPWIGLMGALAFGFTTYDITLLTAGHNTKAIAIAMMAPAMGAFLMAFRKSKVWGSLLLALFMSLQIGANHVQVTYYFGILLLLAGIALFIEAIQKKEIKSFFITTAGVVVAMLFAVAINYGNIALTNDYAKKTIRGGNDISINPDGTKNTISTDDGLDKEYITNWSYGIGESFTMLSPAVKGGGSFTIGGSQFEDLVDNVDMTSEERNVVMNSSAYWGDQPVTSGPFYLGIVVVFLAIMGMVFLKGKLKWGLLAATILALMLSWGKNYMGLTEFFIDYIPGYNKFRTVTIILVVVELTIPLLGILFLQMMYQEREAMKAQKKKFLITGGSITLFLFAVMVVGLGDNYTSESDKTQVDRMEQNYYNQILNMDPAQLQSQYNVNVNDKAQVQEFISAQVEPYRSGFGKVKEVRAEIFQKSMLRSILFGILTMAALALLLYTTLSSEIILIGLVVLTLMDIVPIANQYLGSQEEGNGYQYWEETGQTDYPFDSSEANTMILNQELTENPSLKKQIDQAVSNGAKKAEELELSGIAKQRVIDSYAFSALNRNTNYRVFDFNGGFSSTEASYFHKSLGGYHGAKLRNIQNLIEFHIAKSNNKVLDMLNVKYFIQSDDKGPKARMNPTALGNVWFIQKVKSVPDANTEILSLGSQFDLKNVGNGELIINQEKIAGTTVFGNETIQYVQNQNDTIDVRLTNGMSEGMEAYFVIDTNGATNFVPKQMIDNDQTNSFKKLIQVKLKEQFDPKSEAFVMNDWASKIKGRDFTGEGKISMTKYNPMIMQYESNSKANQFAVFSEIYYPEGWKAFVDGKETEIIKVDYALRGLNVPAGKHKIEFKFDLPKYRLANTMNVVLTILLLLAFGIAGFVKYRKKQVA